MSPEGWGTIISITLQGATTVVAGLIWPWAKHIANSLDELKTSQAKANEQIARLNRRSRRHDRGIALLKERNCGVEHEE